MDPQAPIPAISPLGAAEEGKSEPPPLEDLHNSPKNEIHNSPENEMSLDSNYNSQQLAEPNGNLKLGEVNDAARASEEDFNLSKDYLYETHPDDIDVSPVPLSDAFESERATGLGNPDENLKEAIGDSEIDYNRRDACDGVEENNETDRVYEPDLPVELSKNVSILECANNGGICKVLIVGTAHVSQDSCKEVQAVIRHLRPQVVFLELCESRVGMLMPQKLRVPSAKEMMDMWRNQHMNIFGILYSWFLAKIAEKMDVYPGAEFRVAYEEAVACRARITLGDRPVHITLQRTWSRMSAWHKLKLMTCMVSQIVSLPSMEELNRMIAEMSDTDMITLLIQEMSKTFPTLMETLVYERDLFMTAYLRKVAQHSTSIVAVIGKGHVAGIKRNWDLDIEVESLLQLPEKSRAVTIKRFALTAVAVASLAIVSGFYFARKR